MLKGAFIFTAGVGSGVFLSAYAFRKVSPFIAREMADVLERALSPEDMQRLATEFRFKMMERMANVSVPPGENTKKFSKAVGAFLVPRNKI